MRANLDKILSLADEYFHVLPPAPPQLVAPRGAALAGWIDLTILKPVATAGQMRKLCDEARQFHFATVCVNPAYVPMAAELLSGSGAAVCSVVGFPLGATFPEMKAAETRQVIAAGATEIDTGANRPSASAGISILNEVRSL